MAKFTILILVNLLFVLTGQAVPTGRVVGGFDANIAQFPHQISLRRTGSHTCGGSIISRNFILTAAHCVGYNDAQNKYHIYDASLFTIRAGSNDRFQGGVVIAIAEIISHEDYGNFLNDVSVLRLAQPLIYSQNIQPIPLASSPVTSGTDIIVSGWGRIKHNGDVPQKLQWNVLSAISQSQCKEAIRWDSETLLCLAHEKDNGVCNGDSGGPAMYNGEVVGIAGFVVGGCGTGNPDGYANVYHHRNWIKKHTDI